MNKYELVAKIEKIAPLDSQEPWDCSGWIVDTIKTDIKKVMLALTVTKQVLAYAKEKGCDMIIAHHPLFYVPLEFKDIEIYASHTPMDKAVGGTTETLIKNLGFNEFIVENDFVRVVELDVSINALESILRKKFPNLRMVNNNNIKTIKKIAFCAGSGSDFIDETSAEAFVTGDLKYHTAVESNKVIFDIGHFESEILILQEFKKLIGIEVEFSNEKSPFII